jgi:hypothetical protein
MPARASEEENVVMIFDERRIANVRFEGRTVAVRNDPTSLIVFADRESVLVVPRAGGPVGVFEPDVFDPGVFE